MNADKTSDKSFSAGNLSGSSQSTHQAPWATSIYIPAPEDHIKRERARGRVLRQSKWWKRKLLNGVCTHCKQRFSRQDLTMDHLIPVARGGFSDKTNVVVSCKTCNTKKSHSMPWDEIDLFP